MTANPYKQAFRWSAGIHLGAILVLLVGSWWVSRRIEQQQNHVFEIVDLPIVDGPVGEAPGNSKPLAKAPREELKRIDVPKTPVPKGEEVDEPEDAPEPMPKPAPKANTKAKPRPDALQKPDAKPEKPSKMSYQEWLKKGGKKQVEKNTKKAPKKGSATGSPDLKAEAAKFRRALTSGLAEVQDADALGSGTGAVQSRDQAYLAGLIARLRAEAPEGMSSAAVRVRFQVLADGTVTGAKIVESSGDPIFDQDVLNTFVRIRRHEPPPGGRARDFIVKFRMNE